MTGTGAGLACPTRRSLLRTAAAGVGLGLAAGLLSNPIAAGRAVQRNWTAADILDSIGVNLHLPYEDGNYRDVEAVLRCLGYLGIRHVRDWNLNPDHFGQDRYDVVAERGFRFDLLISGALDIAESLDSVAAFRQRHPGSVAAIEGPNEVNNWPIDFQGESGDDAALLFQPALFEAVKADARLTGVPVFSLTGVDRSYEGFDYTNLHPYPKRGRQPRERLETEIARKAVRAPGKPVVITEAGYSTLPSAADGVDGDTQAKLLLNLLFDAKLMGVARTYIYELLDAYPYDGKRGGLHYGLFDYDNKPKPSATALRNLTTILADPDDAPAGSVDRDLGPVVDGLPETARSLVVNRGGGAHQVIVWNEPRIWDAGMHAPLAARVTSCSVTLARPASEILFYDLLSGVTPVGRGVSTATAAFDLSDRPLVIEVRP